VASSYLKQILGFMGITDVTVILAGGTLPVDAGELLSLTFQHRSSLRLCLRPRRSGNQGFAE
jgi:hypothetical protein